MIFSPLDGPLRAQIALYVDDLIEPFYTLSQILLWTSLVHDRDDPLLNTPLQRF